MLTLRCTRAICPSVRPASAALRSSLSLARISATSSAYTRSRSTSSSATTDDLKDSPTLAIIGGGLSGLSSAFFFLRALSPSLRAKARVIILEKDPNRTGGWCKSVEMDPVDNEGKQKSDLVFEAGPRSIRPVGLQGWLTVEMAHALGLTPTIITVPKTAPSARNRYLFSPTGSGLTLLPSSLITAFLSPFTTPLIRRIIPSVLLEPFRPRRDPSLQDESVDAFFTRRFGPRLAEDMISAMIHGIYSGDTRRLSIRAVFPSLWEAEGESGSLIKSAFGLGKPKGDHKSAFRFLQAEEVKQELEVVKRIEATGEEGAQLVSEMKLASVWGVKGGLQKITDRLRAWAEEQGVEVIVGGEARIEQASNGSWTVQTPSATLFPTHIITTAPAALPASLAPPPIPASTVSVVNLTFPSPSPLPRGFGYLIPRSVPVSKNPHQVLGVIFDSDVMPADSTSTTATTGEYKLTMIIGGSYWLDQNPPPSHSPEELVAAALDTLRIQFPDLSFPPPLRTLTHHHPNCIAQVPPGYLPEFKALDARLRRLEGVRVGMVGGGMSALGVNGCVKGAWEVGTGFARELEGETKERTTGLEVWV